MTVADWAKSVYGAMASRQSYGFQTIPGWKTQCRPQELSQATTTHGTHVRPEHSGVLGSLRETCYVLAMKGPSSRVAPCEAG